MIKLHKWRLSIVLVFALLFLFIFSLNFVLVNDPDFGWHLRYGEEIIVNKRILTVDTFSHSFSNQNVIDTEWLTEATYYLIFKRFSFLGLALISALFTSLAFFIPALFSEGNLLAKFIYTCWAVLGSASVLANGARPQNVSFVLFSFTFLLLLKYFQSKKILFLIFIPLLFLLWGNTHPSYILGLFLILVFLFIEVAYLILPIIKRNRELSRPYLSRQFSLVVKLFLLVLFSYLFTTIKPYSHNFGTFSLDLIKALALPINIASKTSAVSGVRSTISEWLPPIYIDLPGTLFILAIIYSFALLIDRRFVKTDVRNLLLLSGFIYFSTLSRRNAPFFFLIFIPIASVYTQDLFENIRKKSISTHLYWFGGFTILVLSISIILKQGKTILADGNSMSTYCNAFNYPCQAIEYVKKNRPKGNMFNHYNWGGYLIWNLREYPTFIDGRIPGGEVFREFEKVINLKGGWQEVLKKYAITWMMVPRNEIFEYIVKNEGNFEERFADEKAVILQIKD